jgi:hypothetical protein
MSDVKAVRYLLKTNTELIAVVPAAKIMAGILPQATAAPAIGITHVSTMRQQFVAETSAHLCTSRVQVTVIAADYPTQKSILALVRAALPRSRGTVNGVAVDSIVADIEGPDFGDPDAGLCMGSHDFIVTFTE